MNNAVFIKNVSDWLGGIASFAELNRRLLDVADAVLKDGMQETTDILIVAHAFAIKTIFHRWP